MKKKNPPQKPKNHKNPTFHFPCNYLQNVGDQDTDEEWISPFISIEHTFSIKGKSFS